MQNATDYEKVEFYFSCRNLKDMDILSKSDPQVKMYIRENGSDWKYFGETEVIKDNLNPDFKTTIFIDFIFEVHQEIRFMVFDVDSKGNDDLIGIAETSVAGVLGARKQTIILDLQNKSKKSTGKMIVRGEKSDASKSTIIWQWSGIKLMNTDGWFGKSDPFLRFFKVRPQGDTLLVHETEFIKNNLDPVWKECKVDGARLCNDDFNAPIRVECWDDEPDKNFRYIGDVDITINQIIDGQKDFILHNPKKNTPTGTLRLLSFTIEDKYHLIDFIRSGTQVKLDRCY